MILYEYPTIALAFQNLKSYYLNKQKLNTRLVRLSILTIIGTGIVPISLKKLGMMINKETWNDTQFSKYKMSRIFWSYKMICYSNLIYLSHLR